MIAIVFLVAYWLWLRIDPIHMPMHPISCPVVYYSSDELERYRESGS